MKVVLFFIVIVIMLVLSTAIAYGIELACVGIAAILRYVGLGKWLDD